MPALLTSTSMGPIASAAATSFSRPGAVATSALEPGAEATNVHVRHGTQHGSGGRSASPPEVNALASAVSKEPVNAPPGCHRPDHERRGTHDDSARNQGDGCSVGGETAEQR